MTFKVIQEEREKELDEYLDHGKDDKWAVSNDDSNAGKNATSKANKPKPKEIPSGGQQGTIGLDPRKHKG